MKKILLGAMLLSSLTIAQSFKANHIMNATGGGNGGNFEYMRSLDSLSRNDFQQILNKNGKNFLRNIITPSVLPLLTNIFSVQGRDYGDSFLLDRIGNIFPASKRTVDTWSSLFQNQSSSSLDLLLNNIQIQNCSCSNSEEQGIRSHACAFKEENKICFDLDRIFSTDEKVYVDFNETIAMTWHEISHLLAGDIDHENDMLIYRSVLKRARLKKLMTIENDKKAKAFAYCNVSGERRTSRKQLTINECIDFVMKSSKAKVTAKIYKNHGNANLKIKARNAKAYNKNKPVSCHINGEQSYWLDHFLKENTFLATISGVESTNYRNRTYKELSKLLYLSNLPDIYKSIKGPSLVVTQKNTIEECVDYLFYKYDNSKYRMFDKIEMFQGDFSLVVKRN